MNRIPTPLLLLWLSLSGLLTACGDFLEIPTADLNGSRSMSVDRRTVTIAVGDSYVIPVSFAPDEESNQAVFWQSDDETVATFEDNTLVGVSQGLTQVIAISAVDRLRDTCWVRVLPDFGASRFDFPYDMVIYASVTVHGTQLTTDNAQPYIIGAYADEELRGLGQMKHDLDRDYMVLRVWSPLPSGEEISLRCYYRGQGRMEMTGLPIVFDGEMHGSPTNPYPIVFDDDSPEYEPDTEEGIIDDSDPIIIDIPL